APQAPACESRAGSVPGTRAGRGRRDGAGLRGPSHRERQAGALRRGVSAGSRAGASETGESPRAGDVGWPRPWCAVGRRTRLHGPRNRRTTTRALLGRHLEPVRPLAGGRPNAGDGGSNAGIGPSWRVYRGSREAANYRDVSVGRFSARARHPVALELGQEAERLERAHAVEEDLAVEVVALVLHDAGVEAVGRE